MLNTKQNRILLLKHIIYHYIVIKHKFCLKSSIEFVLKTDVQ